MGFVLFFLNKMLPWRIAGKEKVVMLGTYLGLYLFTLLVNWMWEEFHVFIYLLHFSLIYPRAICSLILFRQREDFFTLLQSVHFFRYFLLLGNISHDTSILCTAHNKLSWQGGPHYGKLSKEITIFLLLIRRTYNLL